MNLKEKLYDLKDKKAKAVAEARKLAEDGKGGSEEFSAKMAEVDAFVAEITGVEKLLDVEDKAADEAMEAEKAAKAMKRTAAQGQDGGGDSYAKAVKEFATAARNGFKAESTPDYNREGSDPDGGYTVPEDIVTRVEELRQAKASLRDLVTVENVATKSGRRTFKKRSQQTGFSKVGEGGKIGRKSGPQFSIMSYEVEKFAAILPITNELMEDSDANITEQLVRWISDEARVTDNNQILNAIKKKTPVEVKGFDGLRKAVLVDLDAAFRATAKITTNANGVYWLSTRKDANGRDLLTPIPSEKGKMQLACGPVVIEVNELPNADLPDYAPGKAPFIIGDLKEGIVLFDRKTLTITTSNVAAVGDLNAFEQDMTLARAIERLDVQQRDEEAYLYCYVDISAEADDAPTTLGELTVASAAGTASGSTKLTVSPPKATGNLYKYKVATAATAVTPGQSVQSWTLWDGTADITAETGKVITLVECSSDYKAVKAGSVTVTAKA